RYVSQCGLTLWPEIAEQFDIAVREGVPIDRCEPRGGERKVGRRARLHQRRGKPVSHAGHGIAGFGLPGQRRCIEQNCDRLEPAKVAIVTDSGIPTAISVRTPLTHNTVMSNMHSLRAKPQWMGLMLPARYRWLLSRLISRVRHLPTR